MRFTEEQKLESCLKSVEKQPLASVRISENGYHAGDSNILSQMQWRHMSDNEGTA